MSAKEAADRIWLVLESLSVAHPGMGFKDGVLLAQKVYAEVEWSRAQGISVPPPADSDVIPDPRDVVAFGKWLGTQKAVVTELLMPGRKIQAIKEARAVAMCGLKEAKEAVEWLNDNPSWIKIP